MKYLNAGSVSSAFAAVVVVCAGSNAYALDEIYSPNAEYHELSLEYNGSRTFDNEVDKNNAQEHELAIEAGLTPHFTGEISAGFERDPTADNPTAKMTDVEIEGRYQFFEPGENWIDSGMLLAYDSATTKQSPDTVEAKLLLQKDIGKITSTANIGFEQSTGPYSAGGPDFVFLWNTRYRFNINFQPGIEIQSDLGQGSALRYFNQQEHYIGPAVYGEIIPHLKYQAAWLAGASDAASSSAARLLLEYEMHF